MPYPLGMIILMATTLAGIALIGGLLERLYNTLTATDH
jgi:hypothetical protein